MRYLKRITKTGDVDFIEVLRHSALSFIVLVLATGLQFVFDFLIARFFGVSGVGIFYLVFSLVTVLALFGRLGLDRALVKFIPPLASRKAWGDIRGAERSSSILSLAVSIPLAILVFIFSDFIASTIFNEPLVAGYMRIFAFALPAFSLLYVYAGLLRGMKLSKESVMIERGMVYGLGVLAVIISGLVLNNISAVFVGVIAASYITAFYGLWLFRRNVPKAPIKRSISNRKLVITGLPLLVMVFASYMTGHLNIMLLGVLSDTEAVGIFSVVFKVSMLMTLILTAINTISAAKISELYHAVNKKKQFRAVIVKTSGLATVLGLPLLAILIIFSSEILALFGNEFRAGATALVVLAAAQMVGVGVGSTAYILAMTGYERTQAAATIAALIINIVLALILIPPYGVIGAAIASGSSIVISNLLFLYFIYRYLGVWSLPFGSIKTWLKTIK